MDVWSSTALAESGAPTSRQIPPGRTRRRSGARNTATPSETASAPIATSRQNTTRRGRIVGSDVGANNASIERAYAEVNAVDTPVRLKSHSSAPTAATSTPIASSATGIANSAHAATSAHPATRSGVRHP